MAITPVNILQCVVQHVVTRPVETEIAGKFPRAPRRLRGLAIAKKIFAMCSTLDSKTDHPKWGTSILNILLGPPCSAKHVERAKIRLIFSTFCCSQ